MEDCFVKIIKVVVIMSIMIFNINFVVCAENDSHYFDLTGKPLNITIPPYVRGEYPEPGFSEGLCAGWGMGEQGNVVYFDRRGKIIIANNYEDGGPFSEGLAYVCTRDKYGYIDKKGNIIIPLIYDDALSFSCGLAPVYSKSEKKWGYINRKGDLVINYIYDEALPFKEGYAIVRGGGLIPGGVINTRGETIIIWGKGNDISPIGEKLSEGLLAINGINDLINGYVDIPKLNVKVNFEMSRLFRNLYFSNGLAMVEYYIDKKYLYGFINLKGELVIEPKFIEAGNFSEGFAWAFLYSTKKKKNISVIINTLGEIVIEDINIPGTCHGAIVKEGVIVWY